MHLPDNTIIDSMLKAQVAETDSPMAAMLTLAQASFEQGNKEIARVYIDEYIQLVLQSGMGMGAAGGPEGPPGPPTGPPAGPPGLAPTTLPFMASNGAPAGPPNPPTGQEGRFNLPRRARS